MMIKRLYVFSLLFILISSSQLYSISIKYYASNSIGMKLHEIPESDLSNHKWVVKSSSESNFLKDTLFNTGTEIWFKKSVFQEQGKEVIKIYPDGLRYESTYRDSLLLKERWVFSDNQVKHVVYQYFDGELLRQTIYKEGLLSETKNYVRKSDGSLHLRQTKYHIDGLSEILIFGSSLNVSKTALGRKGDFSLIKSFQNGIQITEKWVSGLKVSKEQEAQTSQSGELIVTEKNPNGINIISYYAENGNLSRQITETKGESETILYFYDKDNYLVTRTVITQDNKTVFEYNNNEDGIPEIELAYVDGQLVKKVIFLKTGNIEEIYREGLLYLIITYEEDGQSIKESQLAGE